MRGQPEARGNVILRRAAAPGAHFRHTLIYSEFRGNDVLSSLGNIFESPHAALMFVDFSGDQIGLHVNGRARIVANAELDVVLGRYDAGLRAQRIGYGR